MKVSIVIPTHNRAKLVAEAIESALSLREHGILPEVVVVNDGSSDNTHQVLSKFGGRIVTLTTSHGERSRARNAGIRRATSPLVGFLDDDDLCVAQGWARAAESLHRDPELSFVYARSLFTDMQGVSLGYQSHPETLNAGWLFFSLLSQGPLFNPSTFIARQRSLFDAGGFQEGMNTWEDWDLWLRLAFSGNGAFVDEVCATVRDPGWDRPEPHWWPTKLKVRARFSQSEPYYSALQAQLDPKTLSAFWEQLACDAFKYRLYGISRDAFQRLLMVSPGSFRRPRRALQFAFSSIAARGLRERNPI